MLRQLLNREGYETVEACDGREGVNAPKQPMDVLILDMLLPEQNGLEVIRELREVDPAVPIIDSGVDVVTKDNVEQYAEQWKRMQAGS